MEVHPPHKPIRTVGEFFLHLFTITIGLLIAVGIEGCVEWRHHVHLVREAKSTLREEITHNLNSMESSLPDLNKEKDEIKSDLAALKRIQENPKDQEPHGPTLTANMSIIGLRDTAWKTAQATGALAYMPYDDAQRYADIYQAQAAFQSAQDKISEDEALLLGVSAAINPDKGKLTSTQASLLAERFGIWQGHLVTLNLAATLNSMSYKAFLENKPAPTEFHAKLN